MIEQKDIATVDSSKQLEGSANSTPVFTEEDLYYINGITKQLEINFKDIEGVMSK